MRQSRASLCVGCLNVSGFFLKILFWTGLGVHLLIIKPAIIIAVLVLKYDYVIYSQEVVDYRQLHYNLQELNYNCSNCQIVVVEISTCDSRNSGLTKPIPLSDSRTHMIKSNRTNNRTHMIKSNRTNHTYGQPTLNTVQPNCVSPEDTHVSTDRKC